MALRRRGQVRIIEAVLAVFMTVSVILLMMAFTRPLKSPYVRETSDLRRLAYNVLSAMAQGNVFERAVDVNRSPGGDDSCSLGGLAFAVGVSLPPGLLFYVDVYRVDFNPSSGSIETVWLGCASNFVERRSEVGSSQLSEAEPVTYTYVCTGEPDTVRGAVLLIQMIIGYSGS